MRYESSGWCPGFYLFRSMLVLPFFGCSNSKVREVGLSECPHEKINYAGFEVSHFLKLENHVSIVNLINYAGALYLDYLKMSDFNELMHQTNNKYEIRGGIFNEHWVMLRSPLNMALSDIKIALDVGMLDAIKNE